MKTSAKKTPKKPKHISQKDWESVDSPPLNDATLARMRPAKDVLPAAFLKAMKEGRVGRPPAQAKKQVVSLRLDPEVLAAFKAKGKGWQTSLNRILREAVEEHRI